MSMQLKSLRSIRDGIKSKKTTESNPTANTFSSAFRVQIYSVQTAAQRQVGSTQLFEAR